MWPVRLYCSVTTAEQKKETINRQPLHSGLSIKLGEIKGSRTSAFNLDEYLNRNINQGTIVNDISLNEMIHILIKAGYTVEKLISAEDKLRSAKFNSFFLWQSFEQNLYLIVTKIESAILYCLIKEEIEWE
ncbi:MAG: hypothetical protein MUO26_02065 [Methanotrichaceae archaeon]|nr:hypothetical protein [Methanotrichaceae archaeon]